MAIEASRPVQSEKPREKVFDPVGVIKNTSGDNLIPTYVGPTDRADLTPPKLNFLISGADTPRYVPHRNDLQPVFQEALPGQQPPVVDIYTAPPTASDTIATDEQVVSDVWDKYYRDPKIRRNSLTLIGRHTGEKTFQVNKDTFALMAEGTVPTPTQLEEVVNEYKVSPDRAKAKFAEAYGKFKVA